MKKEDTSDFWWILLILYAFIFWPSASSDTTVEAENSLLWEISGNGLEEPSHLFGTFHLLKEDFLESMPHVLKAFGESDGVVVEVVLDTAEMMRHIHKMFMPEQSLKQLYPSRTYKKLAAQFEQITGQPLAPMNQMKPNAVMMQLIESSAAEFVEAYQNKEGAQLDMYFASKGKSKFSTWLYRVSLNTALTFRRQADKGKSVREIREEDRVEDPSVPSEAREVLLWAIRKLEKIERMVILLHLEGYGNGEIAEISGLQKNNVGVRLHRIKAKLNSIIKKEAKWT